MAECMTPFNVKHKCTGINHAVPCGKCPACVARRTSSWSFRLTKEAENSKSAHFITITYDTQHVHITSRGFLTVDKNDVQLFLKRLRKDPRNRDVRIKYYLAAEYGGKTNRPHYHAIIFNADIGTIQKAWGKGSIHYGTVEGASIGYTLKYISKPKQVPKHSNDDRTPEFALMSKGLGESYITPKIIRYHTDPRASDDRMFITIPDGKKISMPRYYKDKIYTDEQRKVIGAHARIKMEREQIKNEAENPDFHITKFNQTKHAIEQQARNRDKGDKL